MQGSVECITPRKINRAKAICRMKECTTQGVQRFGLCNKHRKWVEKGNLDLATLKIVKPPARVGTYTGLICKVKNCQEKPRRNFLCTKHSGMVKRGTLHPVYLVTTYKREKRNLVNGCYACFNKVADKYVKGFCNRCYNQYLRGYLDTFGYPTNKQKKRTKKYTDTDVCKAEGCTEKPRSAGFCHSHYGSFKYHQTFDVSGKRIIPAITKNKGETCTERGCKKPALARLLCKIHYRKFLRDRHLVKAVKAEPVFDPFDFD